jgi:hypothetical protein
VKITAAADVFSGSREGAFVKDSARERHDRIDPATPVRLVFYRRLSTPLQMTLSASLTLFPSDVSPLSAEAASVSVSLFTAVICSATDSAAGVAGAAGGAGGAGAAGAGAATAGAGAATATSGACAGADVRIVVATAAAAASAAAAAAAAASSTGSHVRSDR